MPRIRKRSVRTMVRWCAHQGAVVRSVPCGGARTKVRSVRIVRPHHSAPAPDRRCVRTVAMRRVRGAHPPRGPTRHPSTVQAGSTMYVIGRRCTRRR
ncbi:hypothetical protein O3W51_44735 [Streptomyces sp. H39-C1]|nr:hypothetical protein [Streptomyces sp. H39-C1]